MELEDTQTTQLVKWLEEERRKDKAQLVVLQERLAGQANEIAEQNRRLQELELSLRAAQATLTKLQQVDQVLEEFKTDVLSLIDRRDDDRKKVQREAERIHVIDVENVQRQLSEIKMEFSRFSKVNENLTSSRVEEKRLSDSIRQVQTQIDAVTQLIDQSSRAVPYLEEGRRQDNRRIAANEQELVNLMKKIDGLLGKMEVLEDAHGKLLLKIEAVYPRVAAQDAAIEDIKVGRFHTEQQVKAWETDLETFRGQLSDYADLVDRIRQQAFTNLHAEKELQAFQDSLRQRVAELAEVERLFEERVKRQLEEAQVEAEKRWNKQLTTGSEQWIEHERIHRTVEQRMTLVENIREPIDVALAQLRADYNTLLHSLFDALVDIVETKRDGLPTVAIPPAQTPDDGSGIPLKRSSGKSG